MAEKSTAAGPDLSQGLNLADIAEGATISGRVKDEPVLLSRFGNEFFAVSGTCTHYGAALSDGLASGESIRCPWHHACFSLRTGEVHRGPALDPLQRWKVEIEGDRAFVREQLAEAPAAASAEGKVDKVVIVGGGGAGLACANALRRSGYAGAITMLSMDKDPPCDRPNLSKDYLAGTAPEEWIPLRPEDWYRDQQVDLRLGVEVTAIDPDARTVQCASGETLAFDRLLLATGSEPNRLASPGFDRDNVFTLRSLADARKIIAQAREGARAVVIGSSFIGLEAAAALRRRKVEVDVVSPEDVPFERVLGADLGAVFRRAHEDNEVRFHLGRVAASFDGTTASLSDGTQIQAEFVIVGIGVKPRIGLAEAAGLAVGDGVIVDQFLQTSAPGIYAAGDIAAYPSLRTGEPTRIEHWVVACRQGQVAAANMLRGKTAFDSAPFFWTEQYGLVVRYVGHAANPETVRIDGDLDGRDAMIRYFEDGRQAAAASINRDRENLEEELRLENDFR